MKSTDPTPEQIAAECLLIQQTWTPAERLRRLRPDWRPVVAVADGRLVNVSAEDFGVHEQRGELQEIKQ
jgi:hypothetical protein